MVDWGPLCQPPCYPAAVHNIKAVAGCTADLLTTLRGAGLRTDRMICVGHSLGNKKKKKLKFAKTISFDFLFVFKVT